MKHFVKRATASLLVLLLSIGGIYTAIWAYESTEEDTELVYELPENFVYEDAYFVYEESYYDDFVDGIHIDLGHLDSDEVEAIIIDLGELGVFEVFDTEIALMYLEDEEFLEQFAESTRVMHRQGAAILAYNVLMDAFRNEYGEVVHPDDYAGAYIDYDTLMIQLTDTSPENIAFYTSMFEPEAPISFKQVQFSFNQLTMFGEVFVESLEAPIVSFGYDTLNNVFNITLDQNSPDSLQAINDFNMYSRFFPIPITLGLGEPIELAALIGGEGLSRPGLPQVFSIGLTGRRPNNTQQSALITTGHAFLGVPIGTPVLSDGREIGTLAAFRFGSLSGGSPAPGTHGDWAVINLNGEGSARVTNLIRTGQRITGATSSVPVLTEVMGTGTQTRLWTGTVNAVGQTFWIHNMNVTGLTRIGIPWGSAPVPGDSGGTIFHTPVPNLNMFAGVHAGNMGTVSWYFSPFSNFSNHFTPHLSP